MLADPLMQFQIQPAKGGTVLEFSLVVDICRSEAIDLYATYV